MQVRAIKTHKITEKDDDLFKLLDRYITTFNDDSVLVITSKIVSICEGSIIPQDSADKDKLIKENAQLYLDRDKSRYNVMMTIRDNMLAASSGIDESNGFGHYILWPKNAQGTANKVRDYLIKRFKIVKAGVIITDSRTSPLKWGTTGVAIAFSGFEAIQDYIGTEDIFGRKFEFVKLNVVDGLASSAVVIMGEGKEQTPLALIEDLPFVKFQDRNPTEQELEGLRIEIDDDLYEPILTKAPWKKGGRSRKDVL